MDNTKANVLLPPVPYLQSHLPEKKTMRAQGGKGTWLNMSEILAKDVQQWTWFSSIQFSLHSHSRLRGFIGNFTASSSSLTELSQQANIPPPSHPHAVRWDGMGCWLECWTLDTNPDTQVIPLALQEGQMGGVSLRYPVMVSCTPGIGLNPLAHKQQWKNLLTLCQETSASLLSAPRFPDPMARGLSSGITVTSSSFHGHSLEPTTPAWIFITASLKWHVAVSTPYEPSSNSHAGLIT